MRVFSKKISNGGQGKITDELIVGGEHKLINGFDDEFGRWLFHLHDDAIEGFQCVLDNHGIHHVFGEFIDDIAEVIVAAVDLDDVDFDGFEVGGLIGFEEELLDILHVDVGGIVLDDVVDGLEG